MIRDLQRLVIVDGIRTPFCKMGTDLAGLPPDELGRLAVQSLLAKTDLDPGIIDEVILGCVGRLGNQNLARIGHWLKP